MIVDVSPSFDDLRDFICDKIVSLSLSPSYYSLLFNSLESNPHEIHPHTKLMNLVMSRANDHGWGGGETDKNSFEIAISIHAEFSNEFRVHQSSRLRE
jgi:hypothetical protein